MDKVTEQELAAKATGRRVTLEQVEGFIISEHFFTAADGVDGVYLNEARAREAGEPVSFMPLVQDSPRFPAGSAMETLGLLTFCVLVLKNGFTVVGQSACADPTNFNQEIGQRIARADAVNKIWPLLGFQLRSEIAHEKALIDSKKFDSDWPTYVGTKVIHASPATRAIYNAVRGWALPADENGEDEGYIVEYTDRVESPPHVQGFLGYVSWSPKDVFERAYRPVTND